jgi:lipoprotein signal peptidase
MSYPCLLEVLVYIVSFFYLDKNNPPLWRTFLRLIIQKFVNFWVSAFFRVQQQQAVSALKKFETVCPLFDAGLPDGLFSNQNFKFG